MIAKRLARNMFAAGCRASLILKRAERKNHGQLVILCYHRVLPRVQKQAYFLPDLVVTPECLDRHCSVLKKHYDVRTLFDAFAALEDGKQINRPLAAVTFDDGYQDNYVFAAPILARHHLPATFFIVTDLIGAKHPPWYDQMGRAVIELTKVKKTARLHAILYETGLDPSRDRKGAILQEFTLAAETVRHAKSLTPTQRISLLNRLLTESTSNAPFSSNDLILNEIQIRELSSAGHEIASHSRTHEILTQLDGACLNDEVAGSKANLELMTNRPVRSFCYPNGDLDDRVVRAVADAGYRCATSVAVGNNSAQSNPYRLCRRFIHEERLRSLSGSNSNTLLRMELCGLSATSALLPFRARQPEPAFSGTWDDGERS